MTEQEWLESTDPDPMLVYLERQHQASDRKLRLFVVACCRRIWPHFVSPLSRRVVELIEEVADKHASEMELEEAGEKARQYAEDEGRYETEAIAAAAYSAANAIASYPTEKQIYVASTASQCVQTTAFWAAWEEIEASEASPEEADRVGKNAKQLEGSHHAALLREIFGNVVVPARFESAWTTPQALGMAQFIYDDLKFEDMAILADALEEAGCDNVDVLEHCRDEVPHVRGCWVVDLILGKE